MLRISICDDDTIFAANIETHISAYCEANRIKSEISVFFTAERLIEAMESGQHFDLIFLDIELGAINGVEAGTIIREGLLDDITQIIYVSSHESYAMELFKNQPFDFLIKPISREKLFNCLDKFRRKTYNQKTYFEFSTNKVASKIAVQDILFVSSMARKLMIHTKSETLETYMKLEDFLSRPESCNFVQIHKSFAVNSLHVSAYHYDHIILSNGERLVITRTYKNKVRSRLLDSNLEGDGL